MKSSILPSSDSSLQSMARILSHVVLCISCLSTALPPPLVSHSSALLALLKGLLSEIPSNSCPADLATDLPPYDLHLNALQQLDVLRGLLRISQSFRSLLLALIQRHGDRSLPREGMSCDESGEEEEDRLSLLGLFGHRSPSCRSTGGGRTTGGEELRGYELPSQFLVPSRRRCLEFGSIRRSFLVWTSTKVKRTESEEIDRKAFANRCVETLGVLDKNIHLLRSALQDVSGKLSSTVTSLREILMAEQLRPSFVSSALLRKRLGSFLRFDVEVKKASQDGRRGAMDIDESIRAGTDLLAVKVDDIIDKLQNPRGPAVICICGDSGVGKTSLANSVASNIRIEGNFPGGIYMLSVGRNPDLISLQALLWNKITRSNTTFTSIGEGTSALTNRFSEGLPALLVLDDVWNPSEVVPFLCFEGKDNGRLLVISATGKAVDPTGEAFVQILGRLTPNESASLFLSVSSYATQLSTEKTSIAEALARNCVGVPRLIQAVASIVYEDEDAFDLPCIINLAKGKALLGQEASGESATLPDDAAYRDEEEKVKIQEESLEPTGAQFLREQSEEDTTEDADAKTLVEEGMRDQLHVPNRVSPLSLRPIFDALGEVHPSLQECFLDLAAFPKSQWVSFSTLVDIWGVADGMDEEKILLVLGLLASRSVIDFKVEVAIDGVNQAPISDQSRLLQVRLAGEFYELARTIIATASEPKEEGNSTGECEDEDEDGKRTDDFEQKTRSDMYNHVLRMFQVLQSAIVSIDTVAGLVCANEKGTSQHFYPELCLQGSEQNKCVAADDTQTPVLKREEQSLKYNLDETGPRSPGIRSLGRDNRIFMPGSSFEACPIEVSLSKNATKLSFVSGDVEKVPSGLCFSSLKVALLSSNLRLKSLSSDAMKSMERLVVLDLKNCRALTLLPNSISLLSCLELLDLSFCTQLISLPSSIGNLKKLRILRLASCLSLIYLPKSIGGLSRLAMLNLSMCVRLKWLPEAIGHLSALRSLNLFGCYSLHALPNSIVSLRKLNALELSGCCNLSYSLPWFEQIKLLIGLQKCSTMAIPFNIWKLGQVESLHLCSLKYFTYLPQSIGKLQHLRHLNLSSCRSLEYLPEDLGSLYLLQKLDLSHTAIRKLPDTLGLLRCLMVLCLRGCSRLLRIPSSISLLPKLETLDMAECWDFTMVPGDMGNTNSLPELLELDLSGSCIKQLPYFSPRALSKLQKLHLSGCQNLASLPETFGTLTSLDKIDFDGCKSLASLHGTGFGNLKNLTWLNIRNCCSLKSLPVSELQGLSSLKFIDVSGCSGLNPFPEPLLSSAREHRFTLIRWGAVWH